jgi:N-acetylmuramic acid 6-phosphate etherase
LPSFKNITESGSDYHHLEKMAVKEILFHINEEDKKIPGAIEKILPQIEIVVHAIVDKMISGGRLFYIGAGTSGRLAIMDATECPPTFGVPANLVNAIIAGGKKAIANAVENAEDDTEQGWKDLQEHAITNQDVVIGISASGTTPYVIGALKKCGENNIVTASISCNLNSPLSQIASHAIEIIVGPEFITGSTRMKSGTSEKMVLNMISTAVMIQLGRIEDNEMVNMQLTNKKLIDRGVYILMRELKLDDYQKAKTLLLHYGSVKKALENYY